MPEKTGPARISQNRRGRAVLCIGLVLLLAGILSGCVERDSQFAVVLDNDLEEERHVRIFVTDVSDSTVAYNQTVVVPPQSEVTLFNTTPWPADFRFTFSMDNTSAKVVLDTGQQCGSCTLHAFIKVDQIYLVTAHREF